MTAYSAVLAIVADGIGPFRMRLTTPEFAAVSVAVIFLLYQVVAVWRSDRRQLIWVPVGAILYGIVATWFLFALDTLWESGVFFLLVALNLVIAFGRRRSKSAGVIFLDVTLCFCLSHLAIPGRMVWFGYTSTYGYTYAAEDVTRDPGALIANMVILATILAGYLVARRTGILTTPSARRRPGPDPPVVV